MTPLRGTSSISFLIVLLTSTITNPTSPPAALMALIVLTIVLPVDNTSSIIATFFPETCPYLFDKEPEPSPISVVLKTVNSQSNILATSWANEIPLIEIPTIVSVSYTHLTLPTKRIV